MTGVQASFPWNLRWCLLLVVGVFLSPSAPGDTGWTHLGPPPGIVSDIVVDAAQRSTAYAGTVHGVFKSIDDGGRWFPASAGLPGGVDGFPLQVFSLSIDPSAPGTLLAGTEDGVFRSVDSAGNWSSSSAGMDPQVPAVQDLERDFFQPSVVYALTALDCSRSTNGGQSWISLPRPDMYAIEALTVDPSNAGGIFAASFSGIYHSADRGETWSLLGSPPTNVFHVLAVEPSDPRTLLAGTADGVFVSHDGGRSWTKSHPNGSVVRLSVDPSNSNVIHAVDSYGTLMRSSDGGQSWTTVSLPPGVNTIALPSGWRPALGSAQADPEVLFASGPTGLFKTTDHGVSWKLSDAGLATFWVGSLLAIPGPPGTMLVGSGGGGLNLEHGLLRSDDGGGSWRVSDSGMTTDVVYALAQPDRSSVIYAGGGGIFRSSDGGLTWMTLEPGIFCCGSHAGQTGVISSLAIDPSAAEILYAGTFGPFKYQPLSASGIFKSADGGATWVRSIAGLPEPEMPTIEAIVVDPLQPATVYACTDGGLFKSSNGGSTWVVTSLTSSRVNVLRLAPAQTPTLIAGLEEGGVYQSDDGGRTWRPTSNGLPSGAVRDLVLHPADAAEIFVAVSGSGVFRSRDMGRSWEDFNDALADPEIVRLAFNDSGSYLLAGGTNLGVWLRATPISRDSLSTISRRPTPRVVVPR